MQRDFKSESGGSWGFFWPDDSEERWLEWSSGLRRARAENRFVGAAHLYEQMFDPGHLRSIGATQKPGEKETHNSRLFFFFFF